MIEPKFFNNAKGQGHHSIFRVFCLFDLRSMKVDVDLPKILGQSNYYFPNYDDIHSWLALF